MCTKRYGKIMQKIEENGLLQSPVLMEPVEGHVVGMDGKISVVL